VIGYENHGKAGQNDDKCRANSSASKQKLSGAEMMRRALARL
jgi:hypothetical protein